MKNVPRIEESKNFVDRERSQSPISNITDITVNENRVKFLDENNVVIKKSLFATTQDCVSKLYSIKSDCREATVFLSVKNTRQVINESQTQSLMRQSRRANFDVSSNGKRTVADCSRLLKSSRANKLALAAARYGNNCQYARRKIT